MTMVSVSMKSETREEKENLGKTKAVIFRREKKVPIPT